MKHIGTFGVRFARWKSFATYLRTDADYGNDFSHADTIEMTAGLEFPIAEFHKPLFIVVAKEDCYERSDERFRNPPAPVAADFSDGRLILGAAHRLI